MESARHKGVNLFFERKIIKIYLPFIAINMLMVCFNYLFLGKKMGVADSFLVMLGIKLIENNFWFIKFLFLWYLGFYITIKLKLVPLIQFYFLLLLSFAVLISPLFDVNARIAILGFPLAYFSLNIIKLFLAAVKELK